MLTVTHHIAIPDAEIDIQAMRSQGAGGQNVNKVSSAVHLRFDVRASSLPEECKQRVLALRDQRISDDGVIVIRAQQFRSQVKNREDALRRLAELIRGALQVPKVRRATKPTLASREKRLDTKTQRARIKTARGRVDPREH
jgi:ribosome-associated protein